MNQSLNTSYNELTMDTLRKLYQPTKEVDEFINCRICLDLAIDPVECQQCEWIFCSNCKSNWQKKTDQCINKCKGPFNVKQPHRIVRGQFEAVKCYCLNKSTGCEEIIPYNNIQKHYEECDYQPVTCIGDCQWTGQKKNLSAHQSTCEYYQTGKCNICQEVMKMSQLKQHNCYQDTKKQLTSLFDKFVDFKEQSKFQIIELKTGFNKQQDQIIEQNHQIIQLQAQISQLLQQQQSQPKQQQQQQQQSPQAKENNELISYGSLTQQYQRRTCFDGHILKFWMKSNRQEKEKQCSKCHLFGVVCRYICSTCKQYFCLKCVPPEIRLENGFQCPVRHDMTKFDGISNCDLCNKNKDVMTEKKCFLCVECDFAVCFTCLRQLNQQRKPRQCQQDLTSECQQQ